MTRSRSCSTGSMAARDRADSMRQASAAIPQNRLQSARANGKELETKRKDSLRPTTGERLRRLGDILTANLYAVKRGQTKHARRRLL